MAGSGGFDVYGQCLLAGSGKPLCEFHTVVGLDTFNGHGETPDQMLKESCGRIGAVFLKSFHITPAGVFINGGILIELFTLRLIDQTAGRNKLYIDLYPLSGI